MQRIIISTDPECTDYSPAIAVIVSEDEYCQAHAIIDDHFNILYNQSYTYDVHAPTRYRSYASVQQMVRDALTAAGLSATVVEDVTFLAANHEACPTYRAHCRAAKQAKQAA